MTTEPDDAVAVEAASEEQRPPGLRDPDLSEYVLGICSMKIWEVGRMYYDIDETEFENEQDRALAGMKLDAEFREWVQTVAQVHTAMSNIRIDDVYSRIQSQPSAPNGSEPEGGAE